MKTKKGILRLIAVLGLLILLAVPGSAVAVDPTTVSISGTAQVAVGSDFNITVSISNVTDFDTAQYDVTYDATKIEVKTVGGLPDVSAGLIGATAIPVDMRDFVPGGTQGTIRVINNVPGHTGVTGSGSLAVIHFHTIGAAGTSSAITFSNDLLGNKANPPQLIPATWTNGSVNIVNTPVADFSGAPTELLVGQTVTFTNLTTGGSTPYTYAWTFGDTGTSNLKDPTHVYNGAGTYTVALTVTDSLNNSDPETKAGYIHVYTALAADASANITQAATGEAIHFSGSATGGKSGYTYAWDFDGDGQKDDGTGAALDYSYSAAGTYNVTLEATDALGNKATDTLTITIYKRGDADKNGTVNALDVTYIEHLIMGDPSPSYVRTSWADTNADGNWNVLDITATEWIIVP